jgi:hypothetical protein
MPASGFKLIRYRDNPSLGRLMSLDFPALASILLVVTS